MSWSFAKVQSSDERRTEQLYTPSKLKTSFSLETRLDAMEKKIEDTLSLFLAEIQDVRTEFLVLV